MVATSYEVDSEKRLDKAIKKAIKEVEDLTLPFSLISKSWFKGNRSIFDMGRKGPGKYEDYDGGAESAYATRKKKTYGFVYPMLVASGKLKESMINPNSSDSINSVINKKTLELGTSVTSAAGAPYPSYLHYGTKFMPARPVVLFGSEQVAPSELNKRVSIWVKIIEDYVLQVSGANDGL